MAIMEAKADMGAIRVVMFEKKADPIYRAVKMRRRPAVVFCNITTFCE